jgi:hypothetical protein
MNWRAASTSGRWRTRYSLRAERRADETRTFRMIEGDPLPTSFGEDVYKSIFSSESDHRVSGHAG